MFDAIRVKKAAQQIVSRIRKQVFGGNSRLAISCLLKNVLMEQFHVSRQTLREALRVPEYLSTAHFCHIHIISIYL
jgi:DNA-binding FadR family transcriptional regulator